MTTKRKVLLGLLALGVIVGAVTTAARAAGTAAQASAASEVTGFDPFTIQTYVVWAGSSSPFAQAPVLLTARRPIRIPFRPALRSPFRPEWEF